MPHLPLRWLGPTGGGARDGYRLLSSRPRDATADRRKRPRRRLPPDLPVPLQRLHPVHVGCLNAWRRSAHGRSDSSFRCGQCQYEYKLRNTALALFLLGDSGAPTLAVAAILATVHVLGILGVAATTPAMRISLYRWLRLGAQYRRGGGWLWLTETAYGEVVTVGGMALGCLFFACSTAHRMMGKYAQYRRGMIGPEYFYRDLFFILCWIHNETQANGSGRGFAVVGFFMACYYSYDEAMRKAKHFAQMLGETILEPTAADRRRHTLQQQEQERGEER